ncbi:DoxX family protein [Lysobacter solisilvae (ex Woo and Kim 2020)]|uniref:DoxX family protein n=1 Tax=Agrilutibacter terrestris TaxID=2865112 RepID=A0A7H0FXE9_9GAMM|nr:DoxX family protein [Lysobacter terrestris]QNP40715.1 DoxX family protein [Lysobacter terrestris]
MHKLSPIIELLGRVGLALLFLLSGIGKLSDYAGTQGYMESQGVPGMLLPLVILLEVGGSLALIAGFKTRLVAFAMAGFALASALLFHRNIGDQMQFIQFFKNVGIAGGMLLALVHGAGPLSLDARMGKGKA